MLTRMPSILTVLAVLVALGGSSQAWACWAAIAPGQKVAQSDLIVAGNLSNRQVKGEIATVDLTVSQVLKGDAHTKLVVMSMDARRTTSASFTYTGTEDGLWFLQKVERDGKTTYRTFHPMCFESFANVDAEKRKATLASYEAMIKRALIVETDLQSAMRSAHKKEFEGKTFRVTANLTRQKQQVAQGTGEAGVVNGWTLAASGASTVVRAEVKAAELDALEDKNVIVDVVWRDAPPQPHNRNCIRHKVAYVTAIKTAPQKITCGPRAIEASASTSGDSRKDVKTSAAPEPRKSNHIVLERKPNGEIEPNLVGRNGVVHQPAAEWFTDEKLAKAKAEALAKEEAKAKAKVEAKADAEDYDF